MCKNSRTDFISTAYDFFKEKRNKDIAEMLEADPRMVRKWVRQFLQVGIEALVPTNKGSRPPKLTYEEEEAFLNAFKEKAESVQIYRVLHRHSRRKIKPRSRHPKKASPEAINASKKLSELQRKSRLSTIQQTAKRFGWINKLKYCWCQKGIRPSVPCHHIREYRSFTELSSQKTTIAFSSSYLIVTQIA